MKNEKENAESKRRRKLGRFAEKEVQKILGGKLTTEKAPFDVVDFTSGIAYEVKGISALSKDFKVHISKQSMNRKKAFLKKYGLKGVLIVVVIYSQKKVDVYSGELKQHTRINKTLKKIK